jgi:hypothetical protein
MKRVASLVIALGIAALALTAQTNSFPAGKAPADAHQRPPDVFVSENVCPFECCTYRDWVARTELQLHDRPRGRITGHISKGARVKGITGVVITKPLPFRVTRQEEGIPAGATAYLLHPIGEGYWRVWYRGKMVSIELDYSPHLQPKYDWWAQVRTASGQSGWVHMGDPAEGLAFDNVDACG